MTQVERLVRIYLDSRARLLKEIEKRRLWKRNTWHQEEMLRLIDQELRKLNLEAFAWAEEAVETAYMRGARIAWQAARASDRSLKAFGAFGGMHKPAISLLAHNAQEYLHITNSLIARQARDTVRKVGVEVTGRKFAETLTWKETTRLLEQRLSEEGFFARVPWRNGRGSMRLDSYAELVARTTTAEATNTGTINQMAEQGQGLVKMTAHSTTCAVCAPRQGRVYRLEDFPADDPRQAFPHIREGMPRWPTYKTVHPNCAHRLLPFVWSQKTAEEQRRALADAGKPFDLDPRGEAERLRYEKAQKANADRLRDRKQWERYRAVLGKENTPSFSGFRRMKAAESIAFQRLRWDYRFQNAHAATPAFPPLENHKEAYGVLGKVQQYALNSSHQRGRHKAIVFQSALGYNQDSADILESKIRTALPHYRATYKGDNGYGRQYQVVVLIEGFGNKAGTYQPVVTTWEYSNIDQSKPRMVTCYVGKSKRP